MIPKTYTAFFFASLLGMTLCHIPEGEIKIGPIFGNGGRFFGNKHFEAVFEKGADLKPLIAKKVLLGVGALGAGALAAGGAALLHKKIYHLNPDWGWSGAQYDQGKYNSYNPAPAHGWNSNGGYYQNSAAISDIKFPATSGYPGSSHYETNQYPSGEYGYPQSGSYSQSGWQGSDNSNYGGSYGWSR